MGLVCKDENPCHLLSLPKFYDTYPEILKGKKAKRQKGKKGKRGKGENALYRQSSSQCMCVTLFSGMD